MTLLSWAGIDSRAAGPQPRLRLACIGSIALQHWLGLSESGATWWAPDSISDIATSTTPAHVTAMRISPRPESQALCASSADGGSGPGRGDLLKGRERQGIQVVDGLVGR